MVLAVELEALDETVGVWVMRSCKISTPSAKSGNEWLAEISHLVFQKMHQPVAE